VAEALAEKSARKIDACGFGLCKPGSRLGNWLQSLQDLPERGLQLPISCPLRQDQESSGPANGVDEAWHGHLEMILIDPDGNEIVAWEYTSE
jgi:hypothetical protein